MKCFFWGNGMNDIDGLFRKYEHDMTRFHERDRDNSFFHINLAFHLFDCFGVDDAEFFISDLFNELYIMVARRRKSNHGVQFYFSGMTEFRKVVLYNIFAIERLKMKAVDIGFKYGVSTREVYRGLNNLGFGKAKPGWRLRFE